MASDHTTRGTVSENIEMLLWLGAAYLFTRKLTPEQITLWSARSAAWLNNGGSISSSSAPDVCDLAACLALRWSRVIHGDCYDRAVAMRWWCARRGLDLQVVLGIRRGARGDVEGHAWIEDMQGELYLVQQDAGYQEVTRG